VYHDNPYRVITSSSSAILDALSHKDSQQGTVVIWKNAEGRFSSWSSFRFNLQNVTSARPVRNWRLLWVMCKVRDCWLVLLRSAYLMSPWIMLAKVWRCWACKSPLIRRHIHCKRWGGHFIEIQNQRFWFYWFPGSLFGEHYSFFAEITGSLSVWIFYFDIMMSHLLVTLVELIQRKGSGVGLVSIRPKLLRSLLHPVCFSSVLELFLWFNS
jgi:hypothetical protein